MMLQNSAIIVSWEEAFAAEDGWEKCELCGRHMVWEDCGKCDGLGTLGPDKISCEWCSGRGGWLQCSDEANHPDDINMFGVEEEEESTAVTVLADGREEGWL